MTREITGIDIFLSPEKCFPLLLSFSEPLAYSSMCSCRKYPNPHQGRLIKIPSGRGFQKPYFLKGKYGTKMEFPEGVGGLKPKNLP